MNTTILARACAAFAAVTVTLATLAAIDALAVVEHAADPRTAATTHAGEPT